MDAKLTGFKTRYLPNKVNIYPMLGYSPDDAVQCKLQISNRITCISSKFNPRIWPKIKNNKDRKIVEWHYYLCEEIVKLFQNDDNMPLLVYNLKWKQYHQYNNNNNNSHQWKKYWPFDKVPKKV